MNRSPAEPATSGERSSPEHSRARPDRRLATGVLHRIAPAVLLVGGVAAILETRNMGLGELTAPGPGLWPAIIAGLLVAMAVLLLFLDPPGDYEAWTRGTARIAAGLVALGVYVFCFQTLGFILPTVLLLIGWLRFLGEEGWRSSVLLGVVGALVLHLVFVVALGVPFPAGPVDQLLGG